MARLHSRIYLHFLGVLLVVALTTGVVFGLGVRDAFRREMALGMARHVAALLGEHIEDHDALDARVRQLHDDLHFSVRVRGRGGDVLASAGHWTRPRGFASAIKDPASGAVVGVVEIAPPRPFGMRSIWRPLLWAALALAVVAVATRPLATRISRPVERLTAAVRRLGSGDLGARVAMEPRHARRNDELVELTRAFNEMAERVERLVGSEKELLANISHELRSPLARIRLALELIPRDAAGAHRLGDVERDLADLERLIDDVLTATRLGTSGLPTHLGAVDANAVLDDIAERARHDPSTAGLAIRVERGADVRLTADGALLRRAVWNLVENAAKYGAPPITLSALRVGDRVTLAVTDDGPGIPPADRERVFEPFYRGEARAGAAHGVGLGLTLARRIAEAHGGAAAVESTARGCRVVLSMPAG